MPHHGVGLKTSYEVVVSVLIDRVTLDNYVVKELNNVMFTDRRPLKEEDITHRIKGQQAEEVAGSLAKERKNQVVRLGVVLENAATQARSRYEGKLDVYIPETGRNFMLWRLKAGDEEYVLPVLNATGAGDEQSKNDPDLAASTNT